MRAWAIGPALAWAALIFAASHQTSDNVPSFSIRHFDKVLHAGVYAVLGLLVYRAFRMLSRAGWTAAQRTLIVCALYALSDEAHQSFVPGRSAELGDWFADVFGACICLIWARWDERFLKKTPPDTP